MNSPSMDHIDILYQRLVSEGISKYIFEDIQAVIDGLELRVEQLKNKNQKLFNENMYLSSKVSTLDYENKKLVNGIKKIKSDLDDIDK